MALSLLFLDPMAFARPFLLGFFLLDAIGPRTAPAIPPSVPAPRTASFREVRFRDHPCLVRPKIDRELTLTVGGVASPPTLSNVCGLRRSARIVPAYRNGRSVGFKLFAIRESSVYAKVGLENGDIVRSICGYPVDSPDDALRMYSQLKDRRDLWYEVERGERIFRTRIRLTER